MRRAIASGTSVANPDRAPSPKAAPRLRGRLGRFLFPRSRSPQEDEPTYPWYRVLWLTGVDYFSTLGYQPGIAFLAAGALAPVTAVVLVLVTLTIALPVYSAVARRSFAGQGSIAMLEQLVPGWPGKLFVLALLGFAATDFVITMTLSAADAAQHAVENPLLNPVLAGHRFGVACLLLGLLAAVFLIGFREAVSVATLVAIPYLALNAIVIGRSLLELLRHREFFDAWRQALVARGDAGTLAVAALLGFPRLALGLSGFETGVSLMPLVRGAPGDSVPPLGRIANTRRLLVAAAGTMSVLLVTSALVTALLIPPEAFRAGGAASGRALAYLAHRLLGERFGSLYDASTILILWFAGASAMAGMLNLIPRYLPRFGMAPAWVEHRRPLVALLLLVDLAVTSFFRADVDAQGGAYATGVLVLMVSAAVAVTLAVRREMPSGTGRTASALLFFTLATVILGYTLLDNVIERPDGVLIASTFVVAIVVLSAVSRYRRATEFRVERTEFADEASRLLWFSMKGKEINLVPTRTVDAARRRAKSGQLRSYYRATGPLVFLHVSLADDRSDFKAQLRVEVRTEGEDFVIEVRGAVAVANTIAWVSEELDPIALYIELSLRSPFRQALAYLVWGEGEVGLLVYQILVRHWRSTPEDDVRPLIFLVSP